MPTFLCSRRAIFGLQGRIVCRSVTETGAAIVVFGQPPRCQPSSTGKDGPQCFDKSGTPVCCTAPCHVIATGYPEWRSQDPDNLATGGAIGKFAPQADVSGLCIGHSWQTTLHVNCATLLEGTRLLGVKSSLGSGGDCTVDIFLASAAACAAFTITMGWVLVACLCAVLFLYAVLGVLASALCWGRLEHPHKVHWQRLIHLVADGGSVVSRATSKGIACMCLACIRRCPGWGDTVRGEVTEYFPTAAGATRRTSSGSARACFACVRRLIVWRDRPVVGAHIAARLQLEANEAPQQTDDLDANDWLSPELTQDALSVGSSSNEFSDSHSMSSSEDEHVAMPLP